MKILNLQFCAGSQRQVQRAMLDIHISRHLARVQIKSLMTYFVPLKVD